jgi:hypothetical protein
MAVVGLDVDQRVFVSGASPQGGVAEPPAGVSAPGFISLDALLPAGGGSVAATRSVAYARPQAPPVPPPQPTRIRGGSTSTPSSGPNPSDYVALPPITSPASTSAPSPSPSESASPRGRWKRRSR